MGRLQTLILPAAMLLWATSALAALPVATLTAVFPPACPTGGTVEVTLTGANLQGVRQLHFTDARITAKLTTPPATRPTDPVRFAVTVPTDAAPRDCDLWAIGSYGATNPRAFQIHTSPQLIIPPSHTLPATAFDVPLGTAAFATAEPKAAQYVRFDLHKGTAVTIDVESSRLDSKAEPRFVLFDPAAREVAWTTDGRSLTYLPTTDGPHVLRIEDLLYRGGPEYAYEVRAAAPSATTRPADLPAAAAFVDEAATSAAVAEMAEGVIHPPCVIRSTFRAPRFATAYRFDAAAGAVYWVDVASDRLGAASAPMLVVQRLDKDADGHEKGTDVAEVKPAPTNAGVAAFSTATRDPTYRLECKQAGTCRLQLRDLFGPGEGPADFVLSVKPPSPDFRLVALPAEPSPEPKDSRDVPLCGTLARRGGVTAIDVVAVRRDGFDGVITLHATGLPKGLTAGPATIPTGATTARLLLMTADDAPAWVGPVGVDGTATIDAKDVRHAARPGTVSFARYDAPTKDVVVRSRVADALLLAVSGTQASPLSLSPTTRPVIDAVVGTKVTVSMKITRREEFIGPMTVTVQGHPATAAVPPLPVDPKAPSVNVALDLAVLKLPPGEYVLYAAADARFKHADDVDPTPRELTATFYSEPFTLKVSPAPPATAPVKK